MGPEQISFVFLILKTQTDDTLKVTINPVTMQTLYLSLSHRCTGTHGGTGCHLCLPEVIWDSRFSARPEHQSASTTTGYRGHSRLYYVKCHMPGEGSTARGSRRLPESPSSLQIQQKSVKTKENTLICPLLHARL